jgi:hypothetical protein
MTVKLGLYRTTDPILGDAARVHKSAGDAAPYVSRYLYELLDFRPPFDSLPVHDDFGLLPPDLDFSMGATALPMHA